jgi:hypothetical protein
MAATKQRRMLTETEVLSIVESNERELSIAEEKLGAIGRRILDGIYTPGMFTKFVTNGAFLASIVIYEKKPAFVLITSRNGMGWMIVEGSVSLGAAPLKVVFDAADALARHFGDQKVLFVTKIKSLFQYATRNGYGTMGVIVSKGTPA